MHAVGLEKKYSPKAFSFTLTPALWVLQTRGAFILTVGLKHKHTSFETLTNVFVDNVVAESTFFHTLLPAESVT